MTFAEFKRQLNDNVKEALDILEEDQDYRDKLPNNPELEDWYLVFFTVWNDNIGEVVFES
jgi:hypothetical protein